MAFDLETVREIHEPITGQRMFVRNRERVNQIPHHCPRCKDELALHMVSTAGKFTEEGSFYSVSIFILRCENPSCQQAFAYRVKEERAPMSLSSQEIYELLLDAWNDQLGGYDL